MKTLRRTQFGNPILRKAATRLHEEEILSEEVQHLIDRMFYTLEKRNYGVGLAAPQVNRGVALAVIGIKPTPNHPKLKKESFTIINPEIVKTYGQKVGMWEACVSGEPMYAQAMRYEKVRVKWHDRQARLHEEDFDGFTAHVLQHEIDHLNGILYVDRVEDTTTYMTLSEYKKTRQAH